jgi:hypothetical protein
MLEEALLPTKLSYNNFYIFFTCVIPFNVGSGMTSGSGSATAKSSGSTKLLPTLAALFSELGFHAAMQTWSGRIGSVSSKASMLGQTTTLLVWSHSWVAVVLNPPSMLIARRDTFSGTSWPSVSCEKRIHSLQFCSCILPPMFRIHQEPDMDPAPDPTIGVEIL